MADYAHLPRHPARARIQGFSTDRDRLWILHTPDCVAGFTEYNDEVTGCDPRLANLYPDEFHYGSNAYYILWTLAPERGWRVEQVEDRL